MVVRIERNDFSYIGGENVKWHNHSGNILAVFKKKQRKLKMLLTYDNNLTTSLLSQRKLTPACDTLFVIATN